MTKSIFKNMLVIQDAYRDSIDAVERAAQLADSRTRVGIMDVEPNLGSLWHELFKDEFEETPDYHRQKALIELVKKSAFRTSARMSRPKSQSVAQL